MNESLKAQLQSLLRHINAALDLIHDQAISDFNRMARSTGQRTRVDRVKK